MGKTLEDEPHWSVQRDRSFAEFVKAKQREWKRVKPMTPNQGVYLNAIDEQSVVVCTGPWGTGKTFLAAARAVEMLRAGTVKRIVLTRPLVECGKGIGFLPGDLYAKVVNMMAPLIESMEEWLEPGEFDQMRADGRVVICPLEFMRGRTMKDAFTILDEAQNADKTQLNMFLSRYGSGKMVLCGDYTQSDLPARGMNPLRETVLRFRSEPNPEVGVIELTEADIVRSGLARYFHRVLTKPFDEAEQGRDGGDERSLPCPGCRAPVRYTQWVVEQQQLVRCRCREYVLFMHCDNGDIEPAIVPPDWEPVNG